METRRLGRVFRETRETRETHMIRETLVEYLPGGLRLGEPKASASPTARPGTAAAETQTRCRECGAIASGATDRRGAYCLDHATPASLAAPPRVGEHPRAAAGMIARNVTGVDEGGRHGDGAEGWWFRPPQPTADLHHDVPVQVGETVGYQRSPPVLVKGSPARTAAGNGVAGSPSTQAMARLDLDVLLAPLTDREREVWRRRRLLGDRRPEIARALGMTETAVKKALERADQKMRRDVPQW
jgi:DNA-binding CsgD family transcriptional regulator